MSSDHDSLGIKLGLVSQFVSQNTLLEDLEEEDDEELEQEVVEKDMTRRPLPPIGSKLNSSLKSHDIVTTKFTNSTYSQRQKNMSVLEADDNDVNAVTMDCRSSTSSTSSLHTTQNAPSLNVPSFKFEPHEDDRQTTRSLVVPTFSFEPADDDDNNKPPPIRRGSVTDWTVSPLPPLSRRGSLMAPPIPTSRRGSFINQIMPEPIHAISSSSLDLHDPDEPTQPVEVHGPVLINAVAINVPGTEKPILLPDVVLGQDDTKGYRKTLSAYNLAPDMTHGPANALSSGKSQTLSPQSAFLGVHSGLGSRHSSRIEVNAQSRHNLRPVSAFQDETGFKWADTDSEEKTPASTIKSSINTEDEVTEPSPFQGPHFIRRCSSAWEFDYTPKITSESENQDNGLIAPYSRSRSTSSLDIYAPVFRRTLSNDGTPSRKLSRVKSADLMRSYAQRFHKDLIKEEDHVFRPLQVVEMRTIHQTDDVKHKQFYEKIQHDSVYYRRALVKKYLSERTKEVLETRVRKLYRGVSAASMHSDDGEDSNQRRDLSTGAKLSIGTVMRLWQQWEEQQQVDHFVNRVKEMPSKARKIVLERQTVLPISQLMKHQAQQKIDTQKQKALAQNALLVERSKRSRVARAADHVFMSLEAATAAEFERIRKGQGKLDESRLRSGVLPPIKSSSHTGWKYQTQRRAASTAGSTVNSRSVSRNWPRAR